MSITAVSGSFLAPTAEGNAGGCQEPELELLIALETLRAVELGAHDDGATETWEQTNLKQCCHLLCDVAKENYKRSLWEQYYEPALQSRWGSELKADHISRVGEVAQAEYTLQPISNIYKHSSRMSPNTTRPSRLHATVPSSSQNTSGSPTCDLEASATAPIMFSHQHLGEEVNSDRAQHEEELSEAMKQFLPITNEMEQQHAPHAARLDDMLVPAVLHSRIDQVSSVEDRDLAAFPKSMTTLRPVAPEDLLEVAKMRRENAVLRASLSLRRALFDLQFTKVQAENETILSSVAELLIEAAALYIEADQIRATTQAEMDTTARLLAEATLHRIPSPLVQSKSKFSSITQ